MGNKKYIIHSDINEIPILIKEILKDIDVNIFCMNEDCFFKIKLVLNELISNAVIHGNLNDAGKPVTIEMITSERQVEFNIADQGAGVCERDFSSYDLISESNRGLMICQNMCDKIDYCYIEGKGNTVSVVFINKNDANA